MIRLNILKRSEKYRRYRFFKRKTGSFTVSENKLIRKILAANFNKINLLERKIEELETILKQFDKEKYGTLSEFQTQTA